MSTYSCSSPHDLTPRMTTAAPHASIAPTPPSVATPVTFTMLSTPMDMPMPGHRDAPKMFTGKYTEVSDFVRHVDKLLKKCRVTDDAEKCECLLDYCSLDVQTVIRSLDSYCMGQWKELCEEILQSYDADRALERYKPRDVVTLTLETKNKPCRNLTQWRKYKRHVPLDCSQYTVKEICAAAEWHFRRNKHEALIINASDYGTQVDDDDTDDEASEFDDHELTKKTTYSHGKPETNIDAIASMIKTLNGMSPEDPKYAPLYFKMVRADDSGDAVRFVQEPLSSSAHSLQTYQAMDQEDPSVSAVQQVLPPHPNSIPLGAAVNMGCYGCGGSHRLAECPQVHQLIRQGIAVYNPLNRRLQMQTGIPVQRRGNETLSRSHARNSDQLSAPHTQVKQVVRGVYQDAIQADVDADQDSTDSNERWTEDADEVLSSEWEANDNKMRTDQYRYASLFYMHQTFLPTLQTLEPVAATDTSESTWLIDFAEPSLLVDFSEPPLTEDLGHPPGIFMRSRPRSLTRDDRIYSQQCQELSALINSVSAAPSPISVTTVYNAKVTMMNADAAEEPSSPMSAVIEEPSSPMITAAEEPSSTIEATAEEPSSPIETIDREPSLTTAVTVYTDATRSSHHASPFLSDMDQNTGSPLAFRKDDVGKEMMSELVKPLRQYGENVLQRMQMQEQKREPDMESWIEVYHAVGLSMLQQLNHVSEMSPENVQELSNEMLRLQRILKQR
ncbi:hypothetical protein FB45DRAFT_862209 [Roridomyces roridus]|uniref:Uncharacterized protein n=1 Tax=Roridomyces roridus TaxID=1738132 RepID=A0AAD7CCL7_9AGAR|nr:hypothetical protein FB45DRAFT_862209 [Roridomyces roridus]